MFRAIDKADNGEKMTAIVTIRIEPATLNELDEICKREGLPRAAIIKHLLRDYIKKEKHKHDHRKDE